MITCMSHQHSPRAHTLTPSTASPKMCNPYGNTHDCDSSMGYPRAMTHDARRPMAGSAVTKGKTLGHGDWQPPRLSVWNQQWPPSTTIILCSTALLYVYKILSLIIICAMINSTCSTKTPSHLIILDNNVQLINSTCSTKILFSDNNW